MTQISPLDLDLSISQAKNLVSQESRKVAVQKYIDIVVNLVNMPSLSVDHLKTLLQYLGYADVMFYTLSTVSRLIDSWSQTWIHDYSLSEEDRHNYLRNALSLLLQLRIPTEGKKKRYYFKSPDHPDLDDSLEKSHLQFQATFTSAWAKLVQIPLPTDVQHQVLTSLPVLVLPNVTDALYFTDFLKKCMEKGTVTTLLALDGMSYLFHIAI